MKNVYLWKAGSRAIHHTNLEAAAQLDGLTRQPDKTVPAEEFEAARCMARVIGGEIVVGKTPEELAEEEGQAQIEACEAELARIDRDAVAGRAVRELVLQLAEQAGLGGDAVDRLRSFEARAEPIRAELTPLLQSKNAGNTA